MERKGHRHLPHDLRGLIIGEPWIDHILQGRKTWEMRSKASHRRGPIALIRAGAKTVVGLAELVDVRRPLETRAAFAEHEGFHAIPPEEQEASFIRGWRTPWVLANVQRLRTPVPSGQRNGVMDWVILPEAVIGAIKLQCRLSAETN